MLRREVGGQKDWVLGVAAVVGLGSQIRRQRRRRRGQRCKVPQLQGKVELQEPEVNAGWRWETWSLGQRHIWHPGTPIETWAWVSPDGFLTAHSSLLTKQNCHFICILTHYNKTCYKIFFYFYLLLTLNLCSAVMMPQSEMEGSMSWGMLMTLVTFWWAEGGMGSPTSLRRSFVWTLLLPFAKKQCFRYRQYLGLISREELFWMQARTLNASPA